MVGKATTLPCLSRKQWKGLEGGLPLWAGTLMKQPQDLLTHTSCAPHPVPAAGSALPPPDSGAALAAGLAMSPRPSTLLGLGESWMQGPHPRNPGDGGWGGGWGGVSILSV